MKRFYLICVLWLSTSPLFAGTFYRSFNLNNHPIQDIVTASNVEIFNNGILKFYKPQVPNLEAQITYKFNINNQIGYALLFATYDLDQTHFDPLSYIFIETSPNNQNWRTIYSYFLNSRVTHFVRDISPSVGTARQIYVRARMFSTTADARFIQYLPTPSGSNSPAIFVQGLAIAEPSSFSLLLGAFVIIIAIHYLDKFLRRM